MANLIVDTLHKTYPNGVHALRGVTLEFPTGMFGLIGPNGAGKSTFLQILTGLQNASGGAVRLDGHDVLADPTYIRRRLGYVPQAFGVYPKVTAYDLLEHLAILKGI